MAKLIYSAITSLDGYVEDAEGRFEWAAPDDEVMEFVNDLERPLGTCLYGRRMYETLVYWETHGTDPGASAATRDFARLWRAADKIVYSRTLHAVSSARTRIERAFVSDEIRRLKADAPADIGVGGAELAGQAFVLGLVDELQLLANPVIVGGGKRALPDGARAELELLGQRRFAGGVVFLRYHVRN